MIALSYTSLSAYRSCPKFFRYKYIEKRKSTIPQNNRWFLEGAVVHDCLKAGFLHSKPLNEEYILSIFDSVFDRVFSEQRSRGVILFMTGETKETIRDKTRELLKLSISTVKKLGMDLGDVYNEYSVGTYFNPFELEKGLWIQGSVDWVKDTGEVLWVGDFKTSKDMTYIKGMQLLLYVMALEKKMGKKVGEAFFLMLRSGAKVPVQLSEMQRSAALEILKDTNDHINKGIFYANPKEKVCRECIFRNMCSDAMLRVGPKVTSFGSSSSHG
ncbi:PD-(D/E)XK nuclease superfamily protein [uncultured archaeon]|nr:PD-(D/E)XK nuclease superfamily protein [uncultured archaeon]